MGHSLKEDIDLIYYNCQSEEDLKKRELELQRESQNLEDANTALKVLSRMQYLRRLYAMKFFRTSKRIIILAVS